MSKVGRQYRADKTPRVPIIRRGLSLVEEQYQAWHEVADEKKRFPQSSVLMRFKRGVMNGTGSGVR